MYDWSKILTYKSFNAFSWEHQANFGGRIVAAKRRALPAAQTDIPREHVVVKLRDEDAEAVMAKGSDSEKEEQLFPEPKEIPALLETPVEAMRSERKPSGEETSSKKQKVLFTTEKTLLKKK